MDKRPFKLYIILFCGVLCALFSYFLSQSNNLTTKELVEQAEINLHEKETLAISKLNPVVALSTVFVASA